MTRRPFIVVCPETGQADVRTHKDEVDGSYYLGEFSGKWKRYNFHSLRGFFQFDNATQANIALDNAPPVPADAVWGPGNEVDDEQATKIENLIERVRESGNPKASPGQTLIASLRDIRIRLENGTIDELPSTIVVNAGDGRVVRYRKEDDR